MTILLIGCGNLLRRDDGAGVLLARRAARRCRRPDVAAVLCHQLTPELAPRLADPAVAAAIFADAAVSGQSTLPCLRPLGEAKGSPGFGHLFDPETLLNLAERLYSRRPPAWMVTVPGVDFRFGNQLAPATRKAFFAAEEILLRFLADLDPPVPDWPQ